MLLTGELQGQLNTHWFFLFITVFPPAILNILFELLVYLCQVYHQLKRNTCHWNQTNPPQKTAISHLTLNLAHKDILPISTHCKAVFGKECLRCAFREIERYKASANGKISFVSLCSFVLSVQFPVVHYCSRSLCNKWQPGINHLTSVRPWALMLLEVFTATAIN